MRLVLFCVYNQTINVYIMSQLLCIDFLEIKPITAICIVDILKTYWYSRLYNFLGRGVLKPYFIWVLEKCGNGMCQKRPLL